MGIVGDFGGRSGLQRRGSYPSPFSPFRGKYLSSLSFSYQKLSPSPLYNLSVVKLDGSSFDVQTLRTATVAELKQAVEDLFAQSTKKDHHHISWSLVWSHFCLCFEGHKLINDKDYIQSFGIQDGCQHLSINYGSMKRLPKKGNSAHKQPKITLVRSDLSEDEELCKSVNVRAVREKNYRTCKSEDDVYSEFKLFHFLKGWLSQIGFRCFGRIRRKHKLLPSRFSKNSLKLEPKLTFMRM